MTSSDMFTAQDVEKFCDTLAELYSNISKVSSLSHSHTDTYNMSFVLSLSLSLSLYQPILDIILYVYRLTGSIGGQVI